MTFWKQGLLSVRVEQPTEKQVQHISIVQIEPVNSPIIGFDQEDVRHFKITHANEVTNATSVANERIRVCIECIDCQCELHVSVVNVSHPRV